MKEIYNEYKQNFKYFITNKIFIVSIILITILSYGFTITNTSVGVDDLLQDRYVIGTYLLSQGRWGNVLLAKMFNITSYTPFWIDFIATVLLVFFAIILCTFIKKEIGKIVNKPIYYIIFSGILLSYPIIHNIYIYNFANVITAVTAIAMIIIGIIIYENTFNLKKDKINYLLCFILPFFISMYEASCQIFLVFILTATFINIIKNNKTDKRIFEYLIKSVMILGIGIFINFVINKIIFIILARIGKLTQDFSSRTTYWLSSDITTCIRYLKDNVLDNLLKDIKEIRYIALFFGVSLISLLVSIIQSIKTKKIIYTILNIGIILANFSIIFIQTRVLYRTNTSWSIAIAFMILYIIIYNRKYKILKNIFIIISCFIILYNSKEMTLNFYNDYLRYEREKNIAYDIANNIIRTCEEPTKPLIYVFYDVDDLQGNSISYDNGWSVIGWGGWAFGEKGTETTKFINSLGYNFKTANNEQYEEGYNEFRKIEDNYKSDFIVELEKYIIVKVIYEPR